MLQGGEGFTGDEGAGGEGEGFDGRAVAPVHVKEEGAVDDLIGDDAGDVGGCAEFHGRGDRAVAEGRGGGECGELGIAGAIIFNVISGESAGDYLDFLNVDIGVGESAYAG